MKNNNKYRVTLFLDEEEYRKLKYIADHLKKHGTNSGSIPKLSIKFLSILTETLDNEETETKIAFQSVIDKEKNIKAILESIQNDQNSSIDNPKIIEEFIFLSNVKKAIKKMKEDNTKTTKERNKTENENKEENKNKKDIEKEIKKSEEDKTIEEKQQKEEEKQQKETQVQKEEKIETKVENKENKKDDEEEIMIFPDL